MKVFKFVSIVSLSLFFGSGCSLTVTEKLCKGEDQIQEYGAFQEKVGVYYDERDVALTFDVFESVWTKYYGERELVNYNLSNICLIWEPYPFVIEELGVDKDGFPIRASGLTTSANNIRVYIGDKRVLSETSLFHELIHTMIIRKGFRHGDPDHEGSNFEGWTRQHTGLIKEMRMESADLGI